MKLSYRSRLLLFAVSALVVSTGCIRVEQTLSLEPGGSGRFFVQYSIPLDVLAEFEAQEQEAALARGDSPPLPLAFNEDQIREDFKEYEPLGITLEQVSVRDVDGRKIVSLSFRFKTLQALAHTEFLSDRQILLRRLEDGSMEFAQVAPPIPPQAPEYQIALQEMLAGFRAELTVEVPSVILESNADRVEDRRAIWVFDMSSDPDALRRAQQLNLRVRFAPVDPPIEEFP